MIEPFEDGDETDVFASIVIDIQKNDENVFIYDYHLLISNRDSLDLYELKAMKSGLEEALLRMNRLLDIMQQDTNE